MTKILYIPDGTYLEFPLRMDFDTKTEIFEECIYNKHMKVEAFIGVITQMSIKGRYVVIFFKDANIPTPILDSELEIIYD